MTAPGQDMRVRTTYNHHIYSTHEIPSDELRIQLNSLRRYITFHFPLLFVSDAKLVACIIPGDVLSYSLPMTCVYSVCAPCEAAGSFHA